MLLLFAGPALGRSKLVDDVAALSPTLKSHGKLLPTDAPERLFASPSPGPRPSVRRPKFASRNASLFIDNEKLHLRGVNWFGFGTKQGVFSGLYAQPVSWFLDFLEREEFNAVRVPLDLDLILNDRLPGLIIPEESECNRTAAQREQWARWNLNISSDERSTSTLPTQRDVLRNASRRDRLIEDRAFAERDRLLEGKLCGSHLQKMTSLGVLDWFIDRFMERGIFVLLDLHCLKLGCQSKGDGRSPRPQLFFDEEHPVELVLKGWKALAQRFAAKWNVIGADVYNEAGAATWAEGEETDFDAFAVKAARAIHSEAPGWLIFVQGTRKTPDCRSAGRKGPLQEDCSQFNLRGARQSPVVLDVPEKLVYSPHMYGPAVHNRSDRVEDEFTNASFPDNLIEVWNLRFGLLVLNRTRETPAVVIGEWGGPVEGSNAVWMRTLVAYLQRQNMRSNFFWHLGMNGAPVGLVLDWTQRDNSTNYPLPPIVDKEKIRLLKGLVATPTIWGKDGGRQAAAAAAKRAKEESLPASCFEWCAWHTKGDGEPSTWAERCAWTTLACSACLECAGQPGGAGPPPANVGTHNAQTVNVAT